MSAHEVGALPSLPVPEITFDYLSATRRERAAHDAGYWSGLLAGIGIGRRQVEDEAHASFQKMAERIRRQGGPFARPFSELCELRGEPERAERARVHERRLGVAQ